MFFSLPGWNTRPACSMYFLFRFSPVQGALAKRVNSSTISSANTQVTRENILGNIKKERKTTTNIKFSYCTMAAAQVAKKLKDKRQKRTMEEIFKKVS